MGSVGNGNSRIGGILNFAHKMVHSGVLFTPFCTASWLDVERLTIAVGGGLTSKGKGSLAHVPFNARKLKHVL